MWCCLVNKNIKGGISQWGMSSPFFPSRPTPPPPPQRMVAPPHPVFTLSASNLSLCGSLAILLVVISQHTSFDLYVYKIGTIQTLSSSHPSISVTYLYQISLMNNPIEDPYRISLETILIEYPYRTSL